MANGEWTREATERLIEQYRKQPVLYNMRHPRYYNKGSRNEAIHQLLEAVIDLRPETTPTDVLRKIQTIRTQFGQEISKTRRMSSQGKSYTPTAWWYKGLSFLQNHIKHRSASPVDSDSSWKQEADNSSFNVSIVRKATNEGGGEYDSLMDQEYEGEVHYEINAIEDVKDIKTLEVKPVAVNSTLHKHKRKTRSSATSSYSRYEDVGLQSDQATDQQGDNAENNSIGTIVSLPVVKNQPAQNEAGNSHFYSEVFVSNERYKATGNFIASQMACIRDDLVFYETQMELLNIAQKGVLRQLALDRANQATPASTAHDS
uniref:Putative alcohol dehydrogenase transcription factor myb/sant-like protein n=1 Tax=Anopheles darlingi TaxID=43151 RepID=A0A2M4CV44_ANODA